MKPNEAGTAGRGTTRRDALWAGLGAGGVLGAACAAPETPAGQSRGAAPVKLIWAIWKGPTLLEAQQEGADLYRKRYPHVSFELVPFDAQQENITPWLGGAGPHIAMNWGTPMVDTARQGMYTILDPYIKRDAKAIPLGDYIEFQLKAQQVPGLGQYALPMYIAVYALLVNKQLFQKKSVAPPDDTWDWQRYAEAAVKLTDQSQGVWGSLLFSSRFGATKILANGGEVVSPTDDRKSAFATPAGLEALQWIYDRLWKDRSWAQANMVKDTGFADRFAMLTGGKLAMTEDMASWAVGDTVKANPAAVADWEVAPLPKAKQRASRASIDAWTIWKGAPDQDAVWEFMKFLQSTDWLDIQAQKAGYQHPRVSMQDRYLEVMKKGIPSVAGKNLTALTHPVKNRYARPDPIFRKDGDAWKIWGEAWDASLVRNEQTVAAAFGDAARRIDAAMT
jgi:ABC-type glycerol-3-phosphate transport system substrate-binding protein